MTSPALIGVPSLQTDRLILRAPRASDFAAYCAYATSDRTRFVGGPKPAFQAYEWLCSAIGHWVARGFGRFVIERRADGQPLGHVGPLHLDDAHLPDMTWSLWDAGHEGQGYAREAAQAVFDWFPRATGRDAMRTEIHRDNHASQALARKLGGQQRADETGWMLDGQVWHFALSDGGMGAYA